MGDNDEILSTRIDQEKADEVKELAKKERRNVSNMLAVLIEEALKSHK